MNNLTSMLLRSLANDLAKAADQMENNTEQPEHTNKRQNKKSKMSTVMKKSWAKRKKATKTTTIKAPKIKKATKHKTKTVTDLKEEAA